MNNEDGLTQQIWDDCMNRVIAHAVRNLKDDHDLAVRYLVSTLDDLPKGSLERPSDISLEVNWVVHCIAGTVKIQNGQTLGHIRESIDGRWLALAYSPPTNSIVHKDQIRCNELALQMNVQSS